MPNPNDETYELPVDFYLKQHDDHVAQLRTLQGRGNAYYEEVASLLSQMANDYPFNDWQDRERMLGRDCDEDWPEDEDDTCTYEMPDDVFVDRLSYIVLLHNDDGTLPQGYVCDNETEAMRAYEKARAEGHRVTIERGIVRPR